MGDWVNKVCGYCGEEIRWVSPTNATGYWVHEDGGHLFCVGRNTRAIPKGQVITQPLPFVPNDAIDYPMQPIDPGPQLAKIIENQEATQALYDTGLLWLINAAILHPRGYALTVSLDDDGTVLDLFVQGDGKEPWCFGTTGGVGEDYSGKFVTFGSDQSYRNHARDAQARERYWREREENPPVKVVPYSLDTLDLRNPEIEKAFLESLKKYGVPTMASGMSAADIAEIDEAFNGPKIESQRCTGHNNTCGIEIYYDNRADLFRNVCDDRSHTCDEFASELCMLSYSSDPEEPWKYCYLPKGHKGGHIYSFRRH